jgi:hypothetical protein
VVAAVFLGCHIGGVGGGEVERKRVALWGRFSEGSVEF